MNRKEQQEHAKIILDRLGKSQTDAERWFYLGQLVEFTHLEIVMDSEEDEA